MTERDLINRILREVSLRWPTSVRLFRNSVGMVHYGDTPFRRTLRYGLAPGSADLIGIGPGGQFISIEVKTGKQQLAPRQRAWLDMVRNQGGVALVARSVEDVITALERIEA